MPLVLTVRVTGENVNAYGLNYDKAAYDATGYLVKRAAAISRCQRPVERKKLINTGQSTLTNGFEGMSKLLENNPNLDGVMASTDLPAIGATRPINKRGVALARDIRLIDCTGTLITAIPETPLTVMEMPVCKTGYQAANRLIDIIEGDGDPGPRAIRFEAKLTERKSS